jgi:hypothetical protein
VFFVLAVVVGAVGGAGPAAGGDQGAIQQDRFPALPADRGGGPASGQSPDTTAPRPCQDLGMRLTPGTTLAYADDVLRRAETTWGNARRAGLLPRLHRRGP